ncbi:hypothetical protein ACJRO7_012418 [Eucalyptus globulus]|uniref:Transcription initiation factor TFIID subunit 10 n=1 Tax=Eucalyptus globulus TaxID=34317 RepID=A0ABD3LP32_EUCGL
MNSHHSQSQQSSESRHDDDAALTDFLASLMEYTPTVPDELVEHYLGKSGFQCPDVRLHCRARQTTVVKDKRDKQQKVLINVVHLIVASNIILSLHILTFIITG